MHFYGRCRLLTGKTGIVTVNWNGAADTVELLESLSKLHRLPAVVVVVDNGSRRADLDKLQNYIESMSQDHVMLKKCKENLGYAGACNQGIAHARHMGCDNILLLNNDTTAEPDILQLMETVLEKEERAGVVSCKICYYHSPGLIWCAGGQKHSFLHSTRFIGNKMPEKLFTGTADVPWLTGCAMLVRGEVFDRVGLLSEDYFHGAEDTDFCERVKKSGYLIKVCLDAKLYHKTSVSIKNHSAASYYYSTRNRLLFVSKCYSYPHRLFFYCGFGLNRLLRIVQWTLQGKSELTRAVVQGLYDFAGGKKGKNSFYSS
jgi:GT2 family glycosyltransferase